MPVRFRETSCFLQGSNQKAAISAAPLYLRLAHQQMCRKFTLHSLCPLFVCPRYLRMPFVKRRAKPAPASTSRHFKRAVKFPMRTRGDVEDGETREQAQILAR